jgi:hypothetical protein
MPLIARGARAKRANRWRQRGEISIVGLALTATISMMMAGAALWAQRQDMLSNLRKSQGQMLFDIGNGYNSYIVNHFPALIAGTAVIGVSNPMAPSIADIQTTGDLPASYQPTSLTGLPYIASLQKVPAGCTGGACNITGLVCVNGAITDPSTGQPQPLGEAIAGVGADGLASDTMSPGTLWGRNGALSIANPLGSVAGTLCMQVGYNTSGWSQFVRKDGSIGMEGDFSLAGTNGTKHNINNVNTVTAQHATVNDGSGAGQVLLGSKAAIYGDGNEAVVVSNGTVYTRDPTWTRAADLQVQNLSTWNGNVTSDHDLVAQNNVYANTGGVTANTNIVSNWGNVSAANGSLTAKYDANVSRNVNANGSIWAGGNLSANNSISAGNAITAAGSIITNSGNFYLGNGGQSQINAANQLAVNSNGTLYLQPYSGSQTIIGGGGGSGQLVVTGRTYANEYVQVGGWAPVGGGCSPNGLVGNSGSGPVFCTNGVWKSPGNYQGQYVLRYYNGNNVVPDGSGCQANPLTGSCSCPAGSNDYGYSTGQSYFNREWDGMWVTHFCMS